MKEFIRLRDLKHLNIDELKEQLKKMNEAINGKTDKD